MFSKKFQNSVLKNSQGHCFTEMVRREVGETMRCFADKKVCKMQFFWRHFAPVGQRAPNVCTVSCHVTLRPNVKFCHNQFQFGGAIPEKVILYDHNAFGI